MLLMHAEVKTILHRIISVVSLHLLPSQDGHNSTRDDELCRFTWSVVLLVFEDFLARKKTVEMKSCASFEIFEREVKARYSSDSVFFTFVMRILTTGSRPVSKFEDMDNLIIAD
uniref:Uncharacterized protein n=1 Tax=Glossina pallidipes TaxID=7398 RepID=A0A1A9ZZR3_GLOPL